MYAGTPIITSNTSSMPEVAGDAAILVNPYDVDSIFEAMLQLWETPNLRNQLIEKGNIQRKKFSWDKTAQLLEASILKTIASPKE